MKRRLTFLIVSTYAIFVVGYGVRGKAQQPTARRRLPPWRHPRRSRPLLSPLQIRPRRRRLIRRS